MGGDTVIQYDIDFKLDDCSPSPCPTPPPPPPPGPPPPSPPPYTPSPTPDGHSFNIAGNCHDDDHKLFGSASAIIECDGSDGLKINLYNDENCHQKFGDTGWKEFWRAKGFTDVDLDASSLSI